MCFVDGVGAVCFCDSSRSENSQKRLCVIWSRRRNVNTRKKKKAGTSSLQQRLTQVRMIWVGHVKESLF